MEEEGELLENGDGDGDGIKAKDKGTSSGTDGAEGELLEEDGHGDGELSMEGE